MGKIRDLLSKGESESAVGAVEVSPGSRVHTPDDEPVTPHRVRDVDVLEVPSTVEPPPVVVTQGTEHAPADQFYKQARVELSDEGLSFGEYLVHVFGKGSDGGRHVTSDEWKQIGKRASRFGARVLVDLIR